MSDAGQLAAHDEWKAAAEDRSRKYLEARGAWQLASDDRAVLEAERDRLKAKLEAMTEAMGEEWEWASNGDVLYPEYWMFCAECKHYKHAGHKDNCSRGRFFAALASAEGAKDE